MEERRIRPRPCFTKAFTLIELLIVVAIIAILAAIAVPNFLEAQTRAKYSRVVSELRSVGIALESYYVDYNYYPIDPVNEGDPDGFFGYGDVMWFSTLTTPIAYIATNRLIDPFNDSEAERPSGIPGRPLRFGGDALGYGYINLPIFRRDIDLDPPINEPPSWVLQSKGPDKRDSANGVRGLGVEDPNVNDYYRAYWYDPTNGVVSDGDILRWGP